MMTTEMRDPPELLPVPSEQIVSGAWYKRGHSDLFGPTYSARKLADLSGLGSMVCIAGTDIFGTSTRATGDQYWDTLFGTPDPLAIGSSTLAETYPLLGALEEMRVDLARQGAAVSALGHKFAHLAEEVHELRIGLVPSDALEAESTVSPALENSLADVLGTADEAELARWLNAAADVECAADHAVSLAEQALASSNAQVRAAAARVLARTTSDAAVPLLQSAISAETNKLARAIMQSAVRALTA